MGGITVTGPSDLAHPLISVCVCTYRRPDLLQSLLQSLTAQRSDSFDVEIVVVDNDPLGSAQAVVEKARAAHPHHRVNYDIEPEQGISYARNRAVSLAKGDIIAFIDDDELPSEHWLASLLATMRETRADAVLGPVLPDFPHGSPRWSAACGCFDRPRHRTGDPVPANEGRTGNAIVRAHWLRARAPFEPRFALTGGEDYAFFRTISGQGAVLIWCDEATVSELVPLDRQRFRWVLERALRGSMTFWRINAVPCSPHRKAIRVAIGAAAGFAFAALGLALLPFGRHLAARYWSKAAKAIGRVLAVSSYNIETYRHR